MALKADRITVDTRIDCFMNSTATKGGIVSAVTSGSGTSMDQANQAVAYDNTPSGTNPVGLLLQDVVNIDLTRQHENWHKDEVQLGGKVALLLKGEVTTDWVYPGATPALGAPAYLAPSGYITSIDTGAADSPRVGTWRSGEDENGFAKLAVNL